MSQSGLHDRHDDDESEPLAPSRTINISVSLNQSHNSWTNSRSDNVLIHSNTQVSTGQLELCPVEITGNSRANLHGNSSDSCMLESIRDDSTTGEVGFVRLKELNGLSSSELHLSPSNETTKSCSSAVCRICQLDEKEAGEPIELTGCLCSGTMGYVHETCITEWIRRRQSNQCELCRSMTKFEVPIAPTPSEEVDLNIYLNLQQQLANVIDEESSMLYTRLRNRSSCDENRRAWFGVIFSMLLFSTFAAGSLTVYIQDDYIAIVKEAKEMSMDLPTAVHAHYHLSFSLSLSFLVFCATLTIGVTVLWILAEVYIWPHERQVQVAMDRAAGQGQNPQDMRFGGLNEITVLSAGQGGEGREVDTPV